MPHCGNSGRPFLDARKEEMPGKRMFVHDYTRVGFYMITILTANRRRWLGECVDNRVQLSAAGEIVEQRWREIPIHRPAIEINTLAVMPDHIHGIVYVKEPLSKPVGQTIRGFKSGVTSELRKHFGDPALDIWEEGYHDRVIMNTKTLRAERLYIQDNPRRYCVRKTNPELFVRVNRLKHARLQPELDWAGFGNLFLLDKPGGAFFDLCAQGRLLVLSPFPYTGRKQPLTRERCLEMNRWVGALCRTEAPVKLDRGEHEIVVALDRAGRKQGEGRPETGIPIVG